MPKIKFEKKDSVFLSKINNTVCLVMRLVTSRDRDKLHLIPVLDGQGMIVSGGSADETGHVRRGEPLEVSFSVAKNEGGPAAELRYTHNSQTRVVAEFDEYKAAEKILNRIERKFRSQAPSPRWFRVVVGVILLLALIIFISSINVFVNRATGGGRSFGAAAAAAEMADARHFQPPLQGKEESLMGGVNIPPESAPPTGPRRAPEKVSYNQIPPGEQSFEFGNLKGDPVYIFSDPNCGGCRTLETTAMEEIGKKYHIYLYPTPAIGGAKSADMIARVACSSDHKKAWQALMRDGQIDQSAAIDPVCSEQALQAARANYVYFNTMGLAATPTIIRKDGTLWAEQTIPEGKALEKWLAASQAGPKVAPARSKK